MQDAAGEQSSRVNTRGCMSQSWPKDLSPNISFQRTFDPQPILLSQNGPRVKRR